MTCAVFMRILFQMLSLFLLLFSIEIVQLKRIDLVTLNVSSLQWLQMFPIAVTCGNTFVLKPSEKDPGDFLLYHQHLSIILLPSFQIIRRLAFLDM